MRVPDAPAPDPPRRSWPAIAWSWTRALILTAGVVVLAALGWDDVVKLMRLQPLGIDFLPMWAAGREALAHPERVYDVARLTRFQHPLLAGFPGPRPFVYPPTSLLLFAPVARAPFALADVAWTVAGVVAVVAATARRAPRALTLAAMVLTPAGVLVLVTGQVTFLIAAMALAGLLSLKDRPALAGLLFGLAGVVKPQAMALLPIALVAAGQWRAIAWTAAVAAAAVLASVLAFGTGLWFDWLAALGHFDRWVMAVQALRRGMITPTALGVTLRLDPAAFDVWRLAFVAGAAAMVWGVFRATDDLARRAAALLGGSLFVTPYAMHYDGALLAPAAALMLAGRSSPGAWTAALVAGAVLCFAATPYWGAAAVTAFTLFAALTPEGALAGRPRPADNHDSTILGA